MKTRCSPSVLNTVRCRALLTFFLAISSIEQLSGQPSGAVLEFDGKNDHVRVDEPVDLIPGGNSFTIEFWAMPHCNGWDLAFEWPGGDRVYVGHNEGRGWNFVTHTAGERRDTNRDGWLAGVPGEWTFVQAVQNRDENTISLRVYDPQRDAWEESTVAIPAGTTRPQGPLYIPSHPSAFPFSGSLAELRFWHTARNQADAEADMNRRLAGNEPGLAAYWPMNEGAGGILKDLVNGHDGHIAGEPQWKLVRPFAKDIGTRIVDATSLQTLTLGPVEFREPKGTVSYQWYMNNQPIAGATGSRLVLENIGPGDLGAYHVVLDDDRDLTPVQSGTVHVMEPDWPMWRFDAARSADTPHRLPDNLQLHWVRELPAPMAAWQPQQDDRGKLDFDVSYAPVVMGPRIFVSSNVTDSLTAYDIRNGEELWRFHADGPVRLAPAAWRDRIFFVSDDGHLYCVDAQSGTMLWKFRGGPSDQRLLGNERIINFWAARGGPVVKDGSVFFAAGVWPLHGVFIYALDAIDGSVQWVNDTTSSRYERLPHGGATGYGGLAPQGYLAIGEDHLVVAGGRSPPAFLNRRTGEVISTSFRAKPEGGYGVHAQGIGVKSNAMLRERVRAHAAQIDGDVFYKLAARERLFVITTDGKLYCFGPGDAPVVRHAYTPSAPVPLTNQFAGTAEALIHTLDDTGGYALMLGAGSGELLRELLVRSEMHIVVVESDSGTVRALREELVRTGMYGRRAAVIEADPATFSVQPYLFSLIVSEDAMTAGITPDADVLSYHFNRLRPYGGFAWLGIPEGDNDAYSRAASETAADQVAIRVRDNQLLARRGGPLTGAGQWTHQHSDVSNTNFSPDSLVKLPLGVLWFGGPSNADVLPRHGHGPVPQVAGGRLIVPGPDTLSARCVYSGRALWQQQFPGIGHPFTDLDKERRYQDGESVFMHTTDGIGANQLGSPFVTLPEAIYVRYKTAIYRLDPASGEITDTMQLPVEAGLKGEPDWGHLSVCDDLIISTIEPQVFNDQRYPEVFKTMADLRSRGWDGTSSSKLVAIDRGTGKIRWQRNAVTGFRHNAITRGDGLIYIIDGLSDGASQRLERRGIKPQPSTLIALDHHGNQVWAKSSDIFGTWLAYSHAGDILIEGGRPGGLRQLADEPHDRITAHQGETGASLWSENLDRYWGPLSISHDKIFIAPSARTGAGRALDLATGEVIRHEHPLSGAADIWSYYRRYGCNSQNVSKHLITFRSGYAAYYDLQNNAGTGFMSGFRSGCTNNLVVGEGVVNAPDYTRTCTCSYAHQTSLALIHMPDDPSIEFWTRYHHAPPDPRGHGINFGAPGNRVDPATGTVWFSRAGTRHRHPSSIEDDSEGLSWVASSCMEGAATIHIDNVIEAEYEIRLHFAELTADMAPGQRIFDVLINGDVILQGYDIVAETGAPFRGKLESVTLHASGRLTIELRQAEGSEHPPLINGIELIAGE